MAFSANDGADTDSRALGQAFRAWLIEAVVGVWIGNNLKLCTRYGTRAFRFDAFSWRRPVIFLCDKHYGGRLNYVANPP